MAPAVSQSHERSRLSFCFIATPNYYFPCWSLLPGLADGGAEFGTVLSLVDLDPHPPAHADQVFPLILGLGPRGRMFIGAGCFVDLIMIPLGFSSAN